MNFDWARLHAALNDLPAALLLMAVAFDLLGAVTKRESLKAAGFWSLMAGVLGTGAAYLAGRLAEGAVEHNDAAHGVMESHETLGLIVLVLFGVLAAWRLVRRGVWGEKALPVALTAGVIGVGLLIYTAQLGGRLVFEHGVGIPTATIDSIRAARSGEAMPHEHAPGAGHDDPATPAAPLTPADSAKAAADSAKAAHDRTPHEHAPRDSAKP